jgi:hypothetical protein
VKKKEFFMKNLPGASNMPMYYINNCMNIKYKLIMHATCNQLLKYEKKELQNKGIQKMNKGSN